jgi:uncharacterized protein (TIGR03083 family)
MEYSPEAQAAAYTGVRERVRAVVSESDADVWIPSCPDWNVQQLLSHMAGVATALVNKNRPGPDVQAWIDEHVTERQGRTVDSLLDEWDSSNFEGLILSRPAGYGGLLYDVAAHEHDLRAALGRPGGRDSDAIAICLSIQQLLLGSDMAAKGVVGSLSMHGGGCTLSGANGDGPSLSLELVGPDAAWELFRLAGSRRSMKQMRALPWQGELEPFLPALEHLPFPTEDLDR